MRKQSIAWLVLIIFTLISIPACGGGGSSGGGGGGGGELPAATLLSTSGTPVESSNLTTPGAIDYYKFDALAGEFFQIELFAARHDQTTWDNPGGFGTPNIPKIQVLDSDRATVLLEHEFIANVSLNGWDFGRHDLDIPMFRAPTDDTYFINITQDNTNVSGGNYVIRVNNLNITQSTVQDEVEPNDTFVTAEQILPGIEIVHGNFVDDELDYYYFTTDQEAVACIEVVSMRNGIFRSDDDYTDLTLKLYRDDGAGSEFLLADGANDISIDDYYFNDPKLCYRLIPAPQFSTEKYYIEISNLSANDGDADYFLKFNLELESTFIDESEGALGDNDIENSGTARTIVDGDIVRGGVGLGGDTVDWYTFKGVPGDVIQLRIFDEDNQENASDDIEVGLYSPVSTTVPIQFNAPDFSPADENTETHGPGNFTLRAILDYEAQPKTTTLDYYLKVTSPGVTNYTLALDMFKTALVGTAANPQDGTIEDETLNDIRSTSADNFDPIDAGTGFGSGNMEIGGTDVDNFRLDDAITNPISIGDFIVINVYATSPFNQRVFDLDGFGSELPPVINIYSITDPNYPTPFKTVKYNPDNLEVDATSITTPLPTISMSFFAQDIGPYFVEILSDDTDLFTGGIQPQVANSGYFVEVINLGQ